MLKEERQAAQEQQAHLRTKDEEFRSLLEKKDEDLRSKDEDLRTKDEELRRLLEKKDEDLRTKDEDIRTKDEDAHQGRGYPHQRHASCYTSPEDLRDESTDFAPPMAAIRAHAIQKHCGLQRGTRVCCLAT